MRFEVGVDIVENSRFTPEVLKDKSFMEKYFTENEREYCFSQENPAQHFAARFAGKEAVVKALYGFGVRCLLWDVEIVHDEMSVPRVALRNGVGDGVDVKVSLSHEGEVAVGFAVALIP